MMMMMTIVMIMWMMVVILLRCVKLVIGHVRTATNSFQKMVQSLLLLIKQTLIFFLGEKSCSKEEKVTFEQNQETGWHILKYHIRENIAFADGLIAFVIAKLKPKRTLCTIVLKCYPGSIPVTDQIKGCILMWGVSTSFMSFYYPEFFNETFWHERMPLGAGRRGSILQSCNRGWGKQKILKWAKWNTDPEKTIWR